VTVFDYAAAGLLLLSGLVGLARGATREISTVVALVLAAIVAVFALRFTGPVARHAIHTVWLANTAAILIGFILTYIVLRLIGAALTRGVQQTSLSGLDRLLGFGIGLVRALVILGGFILLVNAATPPDRMPAWITGAKLYPLASAAGEALKAFAPAGMKVAHEMAPALTGAVIGEPAADAGSPDRRHHRDDDNDAPSRGTPDDTVEDSR
jgi:membrane protein required for colicin V production